MRRVILAIFLVLTVSTTAFAADSLPGFWGIPFGSDRYKVAEVMAERADAVRMSDDPATDTMWFRTPFSEWDAAVAFEFFEGQLMRVGVYVFGDAATKDTFDKLKTRLESKYGATMGLIGPGPVFNQREGFFLDEGAHAVLLALSEGEPQAVAIFYADMRLIDQADKVRDKDL